MKQYWRQASSSLSIIKMWRLRQALPLLLLSFSSALTDPLWSQIDGGHEAKPLPRPYMAHLGITGGTNCVGFLVAPQWVMTAAHCDGVHYVYLGGHHISVEEPSQQAFRVVANYPHPEYEKHFSSNDIRLLKLNSKATLNEYVQILPLPKFDRDLSDGTPCSVAGWDWVYKGWSPNVTIFGRSRCKRKYRNFYNYGKVCSNGQNKTVFKGITGGPLVCNGVAEGIILYRYPGIYTRVAHYLPWIKRTMNL